MVYDVIEIKILLMGSIMVTQNVHSAQFVRRTARGAVNLKLESNPKAQLKNNAAPHNAKLKQENGGLPFSSTLSPGGSLLLNAGISRWRKIELIAIS